MGVDFLHCVNKQDVKIFAVEPIPEFFTRIKDLNDTRIFPINYAIGSDGGNIGIARIGNGATSFPNIDSHYPQHQKDIKWHTVPTISADTLVKDLQIAPQLIKIDTDGYDFNVVRSLEKNLHECSPLVQFEFTFRFAKSANYSLRDLILYMRHLNYVTFVITPEGKLRKVIFFCFEVLNHQTKNFLSVPISKVKDLSTLRT